MLDLLETLVIFSCWPYLEGFFFFFVIFFPFSFPVLRLSWPTRRIFGLKFPEVVLVEQGCNHSITDSNRTVIISHCSNIPVMFENLMFPEFANGIIMLLNAFSFCL